MPSLKSTFLRIAEILSFESDDLKLQQALSSPEMDWDNFVKVGSSHLLLPAIYNRLKTKQLLDILPEELAAYLEEINNLNLDRSKQILKEVVFISQLFSKHKINHVFVKGAAMLASGLYKSLSERMVGDIDILVQDNQIDKAFELLKNEGYNKLFKFNYEVKNYRHYPRQVSENRLAAVELHTGLLIFQHRKLINLEHMLQSKQLVNGISIPNNYYFNLHNILSWQINDHGYFYNRISLKNSYDSLVLGLYKDEKLLESLLSNKITAGYITLNATLFKEYQHLPLKRKFKFKQSNYLYSIQHQRYGKLDYNFRYAYINAKERVVTFATNKSYRSHILKNKFFNRKKN
ncbi:nucleotidyltransferase family protein [Mangrovimonas sp. TPBH4]|uniref:nucleotidyltransferase family protein n=1 Tax=Mangrovimonas sp. TPBH4 TaxID=1645914 RepID=UPI0006B5D4F0|nr:nucleotidyltransferase family protein [Mangrovimonas sp. TPBH4]